MHACMHAYRQTDRQTHYTCIFDLCIYTFIYIYMSSPPLLVNPSSWLSTGFPMILSRKMNANKLWRRGKWLEKYFLYRWVAKKRSRCRFGCRSGCSTVFMYKAEGCGKDPIAWIREQSFLMPFLKNRSYGPFYEVTNTTAPQVTCFHPCGGMTSNHGPLIATPNWLCSL